MFSPVSYHELVDENSAHAPQLNSFEFTRCLDFRALRPREGCVKIREARMVFMVRKNKRESSFLLVFNTGVKT